MMFLSLLHINIGNGPDRERPGRRWLRNLYRVHQRLCMGFPSASRKSADPDFLRPFSPQDFGPKPVHVARGTGTGFLFRIDPQAGGRVVILVQSAPEPDWDYAFHNARYLLAAPPQVKPFNPAFEPGDRLCFRLFANPVRRVSRNSLDAEGKPLDKKWIGKRVPVPAGQLEKWLDRHAMAGGFTVAKDSCTIRPGYIYFNKDGSGQRGAVEKPVDGIASVAKQNCLRKYPQDNGDDTSGQAAGAKPPQRARLWSVRFDGVLTVTDSALFQEAIVRGIGPGKAFGFGLLSVARA